MFKKLNIAGALLAVALLPASANALTVNFYDTTGADVLAYTATDGGPNDLASGTAGVLIASAGSVGGYTFALDTSITTGYPSYDTLSSTLNLGAGLAGSSARVEISHYFTSAMPVPAEALGSVTNNFLAFFGSVTSDIYVGTSLFDQGTLVASTSGSLTTASGTTTLLSSSYYVTQIFSISGASNGGTANSEWLAPVPVPAAGFLLVGALGGLGFAGRRRRKAA